MKSLRTLPLMISVATIAGALSAGTMAQDTSPNQSQMQPTAPMQPASPMPPTTPMQEAAPMPATPHTHPALAEPQTPRQSAAPVEPPMPPNPPVADSASPDSASMNAAQGQVTINSQPPPPVTAGPPPSFSQLAAGKRTIDEQAASAYPLLANDFAYADSSHDGHITKRHLTQLTLAHSTPSP
jgi:hypothetical protein